MGRGIVLLLVTTVIAGLTPTAAKAVVGEMPPMTVAWLRFGSAGWLLYLTLRIRGRRLNISRRDWPALLAVALLCVPINQAGYLFGLKWSDAIHGGLLYALTPVLVFWISLAIGRIPFRWNMFLATVFAFGGPLAATWPEFAAHGFSGGLSGTKVGGHLLLLSAVFSWSAFVVFSRPLVMRYGSLETLTVVFLLGTLLHTPLMLLDVGRFNLAVITWRGMTGFLFITIITGYVNYLLWYQIVARHDLTRATVVTNMHFLVTALVEWDFDGPILWGCALAFLGAALTGWHPGDTPKTNLQADQESAILPETQK